MSDSLTFAAVKSNQKASKEALRRWIREKTTDFFREYLDSGGAKYSLDIGVGFMRIHTGNLN